MTTTLDRCQGCGGLVDVEDLFCPNCGREVPDRRRLENPQLALGVKNFGCKNCGASMVYDAAARSLKCPFCGSMDLEEDGSKGILAPEIVLPFRIDQAGAEGRLRAWLGSSFWHPNDLRSAAQLTDLKAVFVPFWVFAAKVRTHWAADSNRPPSGAYGQWYPISGDREGSYDDLWVPASEGLKSAELLAVAPFDEKTGVPPAEAGLEGVAVEQFAISRRYARPMVQEQLESRETAAVIVQMGGSLRNVHVNTLARDETSKAALAPVYVMAYRYHKHLYRFVLNGQTGKASGSAPTSWVKVAGLILLIATLIGVGVALIARQ